MFSLYGACVSARKAAKPGIGDGTTYTGCSLPGRLQPEALCDLTEGFLTVIKKMARPTFEPTTEQRVQVQTLAGYGAPEAHIATKLGIAKDTLSKYFAAELEAGQQEAKLQVGAFILDSILGWCAAIKVRKARQSG